MSIRACSACEGRGRVTVQVLPRLTQTCSACHGSGDRLCDTSGCTFSATHLIAGHAYCDVDAALLRGRMRHART